MPLNDQVVEIEMAKAYTAAFRQIKQYTLLMNAKHVISITKRN